MHAVPGEEVLATAGAARALADREQVEDVADVREERIVTLAGEHLAAAVERRHGLHRGRVVVGRRPRADVVGRRRAVRDHLRHAVGDAGDRVRLHGVAEEERPRLPLELEVVRDVRLPVAVPVDVDVVPGGRRERVVVRACRRILAGDEVADDRQRVGLVGRAERVHVRVVRRRVLRDQRCLPVARRLRGAGAESRTTAATRASVTSSAAPRATANLGMKLSYPGGSPAVPPVLMRVIRATPRTGSIRRARRRPVRRSRGRRGRERRASRGRDARPAAAVGRAGPTDR